MTRHINDPQTEQALRELAEKYDMLADALEGKKPGGQIDGDGHGGT